MSMPNRAVAVLTLFLCVGIWAIIMSSRNELNDLRDDEQDNLRELNTLVDSHPDDAGFLVQRAGFWGERERWDLAFDDYTKAAEVDPQYSPAFVGRGTVYVLNEKYDEAIPEFTRAIELNPNSANAWYGRAKSYKYRFQIGRALEDYAKTLELNPAAPIFAERAELLEVQDDFETALADWDMAIKISNASEYFRRRAIARELCRDEQGAIEDWTVVIDRGEGDAKAYLSRGKLRAEAIYSLDSERPDERERLHEMLLLAIEDYSKCLQFDETSEEALLERAECYSDMGQLEQALSDCNNAVSAHPESAYAYVTRGIMRFRLSDLDGAMQDYALADQHAGSATYALDGKASVFVVRGEYENAIQAFTTLLAEDYRAYYYNLLDRGRSFQALSRHKEAIADFTKLLEKIDGKPDSAVAYLLRGYSWHCLSQTEKAAQDRARAIELDRSYEDIDYASLNVFDL